MKLSRRKNFSFSLISQDDRKEGMTAFVENEKPNLWTISICYFSKSRSLRELWIVRAGERMMKAYIKLCEGQ